MVASKFNLLKRNFTGMNILLLSTNFTRKKTTLTLITASIRHRNLEQSKFTISLRRVSKTAFILSIIWAFILLARRLAFFSTARHLIHILLFHIIHGVQIQEVRRPNIGTGVVVRILRQPFFTFLKIQANPCLLSLLPYIWFIIGHPCYPGFNYSV